MKVDRRFRRVCVDGLMHADLPEVFEVRRTATCTSCKRSPARNCMLGSREAADACPTARNHASS